MSIGPTFIERVWDRWQRSRKQVLVGAVLLFVVSVGLLYLVISGKIRNHRDSAIAATVDVTTSTAQLVPRRLDGVLVEQGQEIFAPRAVMVENHVDARPLSGLSSARVVFESPVEGGITRFMLLFDASTTVAEVGPVRSARPYFVEWAKAWNASYFHVGGSPDALDLIKSAGSSLINLDEMHAGQYFWRSDARPMPHNTYTSDEKMTQAILDKGTGATSAVVAWHFQDAASSTKRGDVLTVKIPYGGSYNATWKYDKDAGTYQRYQGGEKQADKDGTLVQSENVVVLRTDAEVLDDKGRLKVRTVGSGDALAYRDGNKYILRWHRSPGEPIKFEGTDGAEFVFTRGRTWLEITTDDRIFAGLGVTSTK